MNLVDTSAWISFFKGEARAEEIKTLIIENNVVMHPYIYGELLLGGIPFEIDDLLKSLPVCRLLEPDSVFKFIRESEINNYCIGWVDVNLIISAISGNSKILTFDEKLKKLCKDLQCVF